MRKWIVIALAFWGLLVLGGCYLPSPTCDPDEMVAPVLQSPAMWSLVDPPPPVLSWSNPGSCNPEKYRIRLTTGPFFTDDLGGEVSGATTSWTPSTPLQPAAEYAWAVNPLVGSTAGPVAGFSYFFTGPMCYPGTFVAPVLLQPANGAVVNEYSPTLIWDYPDDCLPAGYAVHLSTDPSFSDMSLSGGTGNPSTRWGPGHNLIDCTRYYWRVAPITGTTLGPFSETFTFRVETTACPPEGTSTTGMIRGKVFHDVCNVPASRPLPDPMPVGCREDAPLGDGVWQWFDPGLANVVVRLGSGPCPAVDRGAVLTDASGNFYFFAEAGHYCVSVDRLDSGNEAIFTSGQWTAPSVSGEQVASWEVDVTAGGTVDNVHFGWDYSSWSGWEYGTISGVVWHDLCAFDPADPVPSVLPTGCVVTSAGVVHADGVRQEGEPGIPGVAVSLGRGPCPSAGLAEAVTDETGTYVMPPLPPGEYCVSVIVGEYGSNYDILMPGSWTLVPSGHEGSTFRAVTLASGENLTGQDFGWDYDHLPLSLPPYFKFDVSAFCRRGPDKAFDIMTALEKNQMVLIEGKTLDAAWFYVRLPAGRGLSALDPARVPTPASNDLFCWVAANTGTASGDLTLIPVLASPPTPTPVPDRAGPSFSRIAASPDPVYYPAGGQCGPVDLTVTAQVEDVSGIETVNLVYRYKNSQQTGAWHTRAMTIASGVYRVVIHVGEEAARELKAGDGAVEYYLVATDKAGNQSRSSPSSVSLLYCR